MSKHTPGPWEAQQITDEGEERGLAFIVAANLGGLVGAAMPWPTEYDSGDFSRIKANARLIAAAPALLEACKAALIQAEGCFLNHYPGDDPATASTPEHIAMLDAAIRAAEGK